MFVSLRIISLPPDREVERDLIITRLREAAAQLAVVRTSWIAPVSPVAVINGGHIVWRMTFATERDALAAPLDPRWRAEIDPLLRDAQVIGVGYRITRGAVRAAGAGIWRALIFRIMPHAPPEAVKAIEDGLLLFPKYITPIRSWALSAVAATEGPKAYTHVWEQEFDSLDDLTGAYMNHPIHWGLVDAFFDADYPQYVADPYLVQVVADIDAPIMA
jgi:hypothetical protein